MALSSTSWMRALVFRKYFLNFDHNARSVSNPHTDAQALLGVQSCAQFFERGIGLSHTTNQNIEV
jgi:hypothetical protein